MLKLPKNFIELLQSYTKKTYLRGTRKAGFAERSFGEADYRFFAKGVIELNRFFTVERAERPGDYFNRKELRSGYLLYFLPVNVLKVTAVLDTLPPSFWQTPRHILDLGSGPATGAIGALLHQGMQHRKKANDVEITLLDQNRSILNDGKNLIQSLAQAGVCPTPKSIHLRPGRLLQPLPKLLPRRRYDLILIANTLNELAQPERRVQLIMQLMERYMSKDGRLIIIEPALRHPTRELMELRDAVLEQGRLFVHAPCLHQADCPMLAASRRDWCHMYWNWERPQMIAEFDRLVEIRKDYLKASYLVLAREAAPTRRQDWRVVSGPLNSKGKTERLLCGEAALPHLRRLVRLDRDRSLQNAAFDRAQRGDIVRVKAAERVGKKDRVDLI